MTHASVKIREANPGGTPIDCTVEVNDEAESVRRQRVDVADRPARELGVVSVAALPLPTGAAAEPTLTSLLARALLLATEATVAAIRDRLPTSLVGGRLAVDGSGVTQPVSAAAFPLPAGAATEATLAGVLTDAQLRATALPLPSGAATAAIQATQQTALDKRFSGGKNTAAAAIISAAGDNEITADGTKTITEVGRFNTLAKQAANQQLQQRHIFTGIPLLLNDQITFTLDTVAA